MACIEFFIELSGGARITRRKIELLEAINASGSIIGAARELGMSDRGSRLIVSEVNSVSRHPAVVATSGGREGGGATLTDVGYAIIESYRSIQKQTESASLSALARLEAITHR